LTCHICISATGRRRIVSRMMSSFPRMASWRWWFFAERLQSRIRSNSGLLFCQFALFFRCVSCCRLWRAWSARTLLLSCEAYPDWEHNCAGLECAWRWIKGHLVNLRSTALPGEIIALMTSLSDRCLE
jgi:hypothetical protein